MITRCSLFVLLGLVACAREPSPPAAAAADSLPTVATGIRYNAPDGSYVLELPPRWSGHFQVDSLSSAERGQARPGALAFFYLPSDSANRAQVLAVVAVYDSAVWSAVRAEAGPPPGDSVVASKGLVYVVGLPQSNPYAPGSADALLFGLLQLKPAEITSLILPR